MDQMDEWQGSGHRLAFVFVSAVAVGIFIVAGLVVVFVILR